MTRLVSRAKAMVDRLDVAMWLRNNPAFFSWRWKQLERPTLHRRVVRPGDDLVIEGFPRSANTFATYAFMKANAERNLKIGNHFHSPAQFILAARYDIPAVLVIREPLDAVLSLMVFLPQMSARDGLRRYIGFHEPLLRIRSGFVAARFQEVVGNVDEIIARVNQRFGTSYNHFGHTAERNADLLNWIEADRNARAVDHPELLGDSMKKPLPSREKTLARQKRSAEIEDPDLAQLLDHARSLYRVLTA